MKGQGQRQLGPWPGLGGSCGLHHATRHDILDLILVLAGVTFLAGGWHPL